MWGFILQEPQENKIQILSTSSKPLYSKIMQKGMGMWQELKYKYNPLSNHCYSFHKRISKVFGIVWCNELQTVEIWNIW
jgi:hypothetical protein